MPSNEIEIYNRHTQSAHTDTTEIIAMIPHVIAIHEYSRCEDLK